MSGSIDSMPTTSEEPDLDQLYFEWRNTTYRIHELTSKLHTLDDAHTLRMREIATLLRRVLQLAEHPQLMELMARDAVRFDRRRNKQSYSVKVTSWRDWDRIPAIRQELLDQGYFTFVGEFNADDGYNCFEDCLPGPQFKSNPYPAYIYRAPEDWEWAPGSQVLTKPPQTP